MDKSDQFACIRYKNQNRFGLRLKWRRENSRETQNLKVTDFIKSHYEQKKRFVTPMRFQQPTYRQNQISQF